MKTVTREVEIAAAPACVWEVLEDVRLLPELSTSTTGVDASGVLSGVGQTFEQTVELAGRSFTSTWTVEQIDPPRCLVISGSVLPGTKYRMTERVESIDSKRCRFVLGMEYKLPFGPVGRLAAKLGAERRALDEATEVVRGVKRLAESRPSSTGNLPPIQGDRPESEEDLAVDGSPAGQNDRR